MLVRAAILFRVSFPLLLRPAETLQTGRQSFSLSTDSGQCADWFIVKTSDTKTRERFGSTQMAQHHDALTCDWLQAFFERGGQNGKLFGGTAAVLTNTLREFLTLLEIPQMTFTLGSFRAGGATAHVLEHEN
jgi:hypothetical protein